MIWDIIRDFIVQYITGGVDSTETYYNANIGWGGNANGDYYSGVEVGFFPFGDMNGDNVFYTLSDWLATTLTIIIMILIVVFAIWLVRWVFKAVTSAFLLK